MSTTVQSRGRSLSKSPTTGTLRLKHRPSQLDQLDDTTFTSLPLPPPLHGHITARSSSLVLTLSMLNSGEKRRGLDLGTSDGIVIVDDYFVSPKGKVIPYYKYRLWKIFYAVAYKYNL
ncbi:hypothetical protein Cantr_03827 [Candida viswanathii]|uniref:Uncharacterized protein n=1 Tax=Candida viswanathii TaxID=5486 RepID=A0A367XMC8_9ASCO|nr:hypothetical protein Cantr_03827 [Candida viswanathii]